MDIAALITWIATALGGFVLLGRWLTQRNQPDAQPSRIGPGLIFGHFLLAAGGLVIWLVYVFGVESATLRWIALVVLLLVAGLGFTMFARWLADRRSPEPPATPEQRFPVIIVGGHGLLGAITLVLVALVAFGIGQG